MPISAVDAISPAFGHTQQQLTRPFRASQWAKLGLVGLLAGEMGSGGGGGCNPGSFQMPHANHTQRLFDTGFPSISPMLTASLIAVLVVAGFFFLILFLYVNSVMRFVLFDSVVAKDCRIWQSWVRRQGPGRRFFVWQIVLSLGSMMGLTILVGIPAGFAFLVGWLKAPKDHMIPLVLGGMALFFVLFVFIVSLLLVHVLTKDFVVPQMALEEIGAFEGWRRLWPQIKGEKLGFAGYVGMKIVLAIGAAIILGIVSAIVFLLLLIPIGGLGAVAVIGGMAAGLTWNLYTITLAVVLGSIAIFTLLYVMSLVSVPAVVFFPAYSIHFFASRYPALDALIHPAPPVVLPPPPPPDEPPPPELPPLLPTPEPIV